MAEQEQEQQKQQESVQNQANTSPVSPPVLPSILPPPIAGEPSPIKIVLTANNRLGRDIAGQRRREERLQRLRDAFQQATSFAVAQGADLFIQAGNLFDTTTPDERDRTFVASCLARLKQAGIPVVALGGIHDTPVSTSDDGSSAPAFVLPPAPQRSYAQLGALHYFSPLNSEREGEPLFLDIHNQRLGIVGVGWSEASPFDRADIERAGSAGSAGRPEHGARGGNESNTNGLSLLLLHAPIEGMNSTPLRVAGRETPIVIKREDIARQTSIRVILDGFAHHYNRTRLGNTEVIAPGSTQDDTSDEASASQAPGLPGLPGPGFVYMGLASDGIRWCNHIPADALLARQLTILLSELWTKDESKDGKDARDARDARDAKDVKNPTTLILERLEPLCNAETMIWLRLEGEVTRRQYHQLDLNSIRQYGEQHCFSLAIDDSSATLLPDQYSEYSDSDDTYDSSLYNPYSPTTLTQERGERFSLRQEVIALADHWIADAQFDEQECKTLHYVKEDVLAAIDKMSKRKHA